MEHAALDDEPIATALRAEVERLRSELSGRLEADEVRELELAAALRDVELRTAYGAALERWLDEREVDLARLRSHLDHVDGVLAELPQLNQRADELRRRAQAAESQVPDLAMELAWLQQELGKFQQRKVVRIADAWSARLRRRPRLWRMIIWMHNIPVGDQPKSK